MKNSKVEVRVPLQKQKHLSGEAREKLWRLFKTDLFAFFDAIEIDSKPLSGLKKIATSADWQFNLSGGSMLVLTARSITTSPSRTRAQTDRAVGKIQILAARYPDLLGPPEVIAD